MHEDRKQNDDWKRDADKPQQKTFSEAHDRLLFLLSSNKHDEARKVPSCDAGLQPCAWERRQHLIGDRYATNVLSSN
jgi:hypothetical protein